MIRSHTFLLLTTLLLPLCGLGPAPQPARFLIGHVDDPSLREFSGVVESRKHPGLFWAHNDSGNPAELYLLNRQGHVVAKWPVAGAPNVDWEDIALDNQGHLYLSDMGNNDRRRQEVYVYQFDEPAEPRKPDAPLKPRQSWKIHYPPSGPFDCESLAVWKGNAYLLPKLRTFQPAPLYRFSLAPAAHPIALERVGETPVRAPVTGADISADGNRFLILTVFGPYVLSIHGDPSEATHANVAVAHTTFVAPFLEAGCFIKEGIFAGTEPGELFLFSWEALGIK